MHTYIYTYNHLCKLYTCMYIYIYVYVYIHIYSCLLIGAKSGPRGRERDEDARVQWQCKTNTYNSNVGSPAGPTVRNSVNNQGADR